MPYMLLAAASHAAASHAISPPVRLHTVLTAWQDGPLSLAALAVELLLAAWYLWSARRLGRRGRHWSGWRTASFLAGTATTVVAVQSGLAAYDDSVFWMHVTQHLLLMNVAAVFYVLSAPVTLALQASSRRTQHLVLKVLHNPVVETVTRPAVVAVIGYGTMIGYFMTPIYTLSLEHPLFHDYTHLHFLVAGYLMWSVAIGVDPTRWRLSYLGKIGFLAVGVPINAVLGISLTTSRISIAPAFHSVTDTHIGGSILWVSGELVSLAAISVLAYRWMQYEERQAVRADRRADAEAARAAAATSDATSTIAGSDMEPGPTGVVAGPGMAGTPTGPGPVGGALGPPPAPLTVPVSGSGTTR